jgi:colicin import membrane protein
MRKPGVVLRRPVGSNGPFKELAHLPTHLPADAVKGRSEQARAKHQKQPSAKIDPRRTAKPHSRSSASRGDAKASTGRKKPLMRSSVRDESRQLRRPKQRLKQRSGTMTRRRAQSKPSAPPSRSAPGGSPRKGTVNFVPADLR